MRKIFENPYAMDSFLITDVTDPRIKFFYEVYKEDYISSMPQSRMLKKLTAGEVLKVEGLARDLIKEEGKIIFVAVRKAPKFVTESESEGKMRGRFVMSLEPVGYLAFRFVPSEGMAGGDTMLRCDRIYLAEKFRVLA